jgi:hypothetical protein
MLSFEVGGGGELGVACQLSQPNVALGARERGEIRKWFKSPPHF